MPFLPVGGQAVIEGVMMRAPSKIAVVVRRADGATEAMDRPFVSVTMRHRLLRLPIVRGAVSMFETMYLGMSALNFSADVAAREDSPAPAAVSGDAPATEAGSDAAPAAGEDELKKPGAAFAVAQGVSVVLALGLGLLLFVGMPAVVTPLLQHAFHLEGRAAFGLIDGALRLLVFIGYLLLISQWREMARVLGYHGAEHKAIHAIEAGVELTPENVQRFPRLHPRCGTTFLFIVVLVSIVVFTAIGRPTGILPHVLRVASMPLIAGVAFEFIRLSGKYYSVPLVRAITWPGMQFQRLTTREPDLEMCAVAIASLKRVLDDPTVVKLQAQGGRPDVSFVQ
jgi:uncharacterized protein YqhQ